MLHYLANSLPSSFHSILVCYSQATVGSGAERGLLRAHFPITYLNPVLKEQSSKNHPKLIFLICLLEIIKFEHSWQEKDFFSVKGALFTFYPFLL